MKSVGLDIGSYSIKVAEVDASGKNAGVVIGYHEFPLNPDPRADQQLELFEALRSIGNMYDPATTRFIASIPQNEISVRLKTFPFKERQKILKALAFELEDEIPLDFDDAIFDAKITEYLGTEAQVLALACPKDNIKRVLDLCIGGGFEADIVSAEGLALANCFEKWWLPPSQMPAREFNDENTRTSFVPVAPASAGEGRLILDIGHTRSLLLCYRDNTLVGVRSILWGGVEVASALAKTFGVPLLEGMNILKRKSFILMNSAGASRDQIVLSKTVSGEIDNLIRELRLTVLDLKTEHNLMFNRLELLGGTSQIQNLAPYFTQMLEIPANLCKHFENQRAVYLDNAPGLEVVSATAIGLAIEGVKKPRNPAINFRRGEFQRQNKTFKLLWEKWRPAAVAFTIAFFMFTAYAFMRESMADSLAISMEEKIVDQAGSVLTAKKDRNISGIHRFINEKKAEINSRVQLAKFDNYASAMTVLKKVVAAIPVGTTVGGVKINVGVKRFKVENDQVTFEGVVNAPVHVDEIRKALQKVALPKSIVKGNSPAGGTGTPFQFTFKVNRFTE